MKTKTKTKELVITEIKALDKILKKATPEILEIVRSDLDILENNPKLDPKGNLAQTIFALTRQELIKRGIKINDAEKMLCE